MAGLEHEDVVAWPHGPRILEPVPVLKEYHVVPYKQLPCDACAASRGTGVRSHSDRDLYVVATASGTIEVYSLSFNALVVTFQALHPRVTTVRHNPVTDW